VYQAGALRDLRAFAMERSPFYRRFHAGLDRRPLHELPILTKAQLVEAYDELVTDPRLKLSELEAQLPELGAERYLGQYRVAATSGTTGRRAIFVWDPREWATVMASYSRPYAWAGIKPGPFQRRKMAVVSSRTPWHQSSVVAASAHSRFLPTLRLDATDPLSETCSKLDEFQPDGLVTYATISGALAEEQLAGRLNIRPQAVMCASEVLAPGVRRRVREACGRPYATLMGVQGRADETLHLPGPVHPVVFHQLLEGITGHGWQVVLEDERLHIDVITDGPLESQALADRVERELTRLGLRPPPVVVQRVDAIARGATGKAPLVRSERTRR
jgi:phenylacetate-coenzyme A ligase PaaK-like adenylate-forming protein